MPISVVQEKSCFNVWNMTVWFHNKAWSLKTGWWGSTYTLRKPDRSYLTCVDRMFLHKIYCGENARTCFSDHIVDLCHILVKLCLATSDNHGSSCIRGRSGWKREWRTRFSTLACQNISAGISYTIHWLCTALLRRLYRRRVHYAPSTPWCLVSTTFASWGPQKERVGHKQEVYTDTFTTHMSEVVNYLSGKVSNFVEMRK